MNDRDIFIICVYDYWRFSSYNFLPALYIILGSQDHLKITWYIFLTDRQWTITRILFFFCNMYSAFIYSLMILKKYRHWSASPSASAFLRVSALSIILPSLAIRSRTSCFLASSSASSTSSSCFKLARSAYAFLRASSYSAWPWPAPPSYKLSTIDLVS